MLIAFRVIICYTAVVSLFMLFQGRKKEDITHQEICQQLDSVLKDKDYIAHLQYLENRQTEKKLLVYNSYGINTGQNKK